MASRQLYAERSDSFQARGEEFSPPSTDGGSHVRPGRATMARDDPRGDLAPVSDNRSEKPRRRQAARPSEVLTALPSSRPHRRSDKRAAGPESASAQDAAVPPKPPPPKAASVGKAAPPPERASVRKAAPPPKPASVRKAAPPPKPASVRKAAPAPERATRPRAAPRPRREPPLRQPPQPRGLPPRPERSAPASLGRTDLLSTAVQAAAELAEIGLSASARALRQAVSRLPRA
jgi:hypothetical protein